MKDLHLHSAGEVKIIEESQLDRIEKKMDRILHLLESGDLSISGSRVISQAKISKYKSIRTN